ncbi:MAG TPA: AraC family transcriptional regulator [Acidobacteriaceae bacterium]|nr:AraC family transcriptional regulator [Acidobacteriaceae bacterium]
MTERRPIPEWKTPKARLLAAQPGWSVHEFICTAGPGDRAFEEQHSRTSVAIVLSGTFQYRTTTGRELMSPGSLLLGNSGHAFTCGHEHAAGDRCISFHYSEEFLDHAGFGAERQRFRIPRIPPIRPLASLVASATGLLRPSADPASFEEIAFQLIDRATRLQKGLFPRRQASDAAAACARVTRVLRAIEAEPDAPLTLRDMAAHAGLSPWHFLRCFEHLTGATPRQYLLRTRLRHAAIRLRDESTRVLDIAFDCGFGDVSNFNRAFRAEFGRSPRAFRAA